MYWKFYLCTTCYTKGLKSVLCISDFTSIFKLCSQECFQKYLEKADFNSTHCCVLEGNIHVIRNHKRKEGGQKMAIFYYVHYWEYSQREGVGSENLKPWLSNTWMIPKRIGKCTQSWFNFTRGHKARLILSKGADGCLDRCTVCWNGF